jgi:hypothetical protein
LWVPWLGRHKACPYICLRWALTWQGRGKPRPYIFLLWGGHEARPYVHGVDKPVAAAGQRLHVSGRIGVVAQGLSQFLDGRLDAVLVLDDRPVGPQDADDLLVRDEIAGTLQQESQNLEGLLLQLDLGTVTTQFAGPEVQLKDPEADQPVVGVEMTQRRPPFCRSQPWLRMNPPGTDVIVTGLAGNSRRQRQPAPAMSGAVRARPVSASRFTGPDKPHRHSQLLVH